MFLQTLILLGGLVLVLVGADVLVDGSSAIARKLGLSEFVIGLTIVALGTSAPEMVVSFISSIQGRSDMAMGNIIGSNVFNTALILGLTAVICPMTITRSNLKRDIPFNIFVTVLLVVLGLNFTLFGLGQNYLSRIDGAVLLAFFILYLAVSFKSGKNEASEEAPEESGIKSMWLAVLMVLGGLAALIFGGEIFVRSAQNIAAALGLSDKFIAITVLAGGTSLPELATCVVAAAKGKGQLALGNILGSNTFNILLILGGAALIRPLKIESISFVDFGAVLLCALCVMLSAIMSRKKMLGRGAGAVLLLIEVAYMTYLIMTT